MTESEERRRLASGSAVLRAQLLSTGLVPSAELPMVDLSKRGVVAWFEANGYPSIAWAVATGFGRPPARMIPYGGATTTG